MSKFSKTYISRPRKISCQRKAPSLLERIPKRSGAGWNGKCHYSFSVVRSANCYTTCICAHHLNYFFNSLNPRILLPRVKPIIPRKSPHSNAEKSVQSQSIKVTQTLCLNLNRNSRQPQLKMTKKLADSK
jgi:hypothetical protein